ncbi:MAG: ATP-binding protein [Legionellales bacterium]|jgi:hypothetical protein
MDSWDKDFFPQGIAVGTNFCNRTQEREKIHNNIMSIRPTLIISPRRYGKTSLVLYVLSELKISFAHIDLYAELNEAEIQNSILNAIGDILYSMEKGAQKALQFVMDFFADYSVGFKFSGKRIHIEFSKSKKSPAKIILDALRKLDQTLKTKKQTVVLFFDEFQRIAQISESHAIEAALRSIAQESKNIMFIFSGSNRNLLINLFDDYSKPLYKLCDKITLSRIEAVDYIPFIEHKFKKIWSENVTLPVIEKIMEVTEKHPYYMNVLCHKLTALKSAPTEKNVQETWHKYALSEKTNITAESDKLSSNQSKMLIAISKYSDLAPMAKEFIALTGFSVSSAFQSIKVLEKMDYIQSLDNGLYLVVDPLIKYIYSVKMVGN